MINLIGAKNAPSFDDPLEMLLTCHERIRAQCATLSKLVLHLPQHGCDAQAQQAAVAILRYFDSAGQHHHQDEELDLFPLLLATENKTAQILIERLLADHQVMSAAWQNLRPLLVAISKNVTEQLEASIAQHFIDVYDRHIEIENTQLLPLANSLLSTDQLQSLGIKMAARRSMKAGTTNTATPA
jgi:hemerythrin-like domain-containing protein